MQSIGTSWHLLHVPLSHRPSLSNVSLSPCPNVNQNPPLPLIHADGHNSHLWPSPGARRRILANTARAPCLRQAATSGRSRPRRRTCDEAGPQHTGREQRQRAHIRGRAGEPGVHAGGWSHGRGDAAWKSHVRIFSSVRMRRA